MSSKATLSKSEKKEIIRYTWAHVIIIFNKYNSSFLIIKLTKNLIFPFKSCKNIKYCL